jgi:hypothetical protein
VKDNCSREKFHELNENRAADSKQDPHHTVGWFESTDVDLSWGYKEEARAGNLKPNLLFIREISHTKSGGAFLQTVLDWCIKSSNEIFFSFTFVLTMPGIQNAMKNPREMKPAVNASAYCIFICYILVGGLGKNGLKLCQNTMFYML